MEDEYPNFSEKKLEFFPKIFVLNECILNLKYPKLNEFCFKGRNK